MLILKGNFLKFKSGATLLAGWLAGWLVTVLVCCPAPAWSAPGHAAGPGRVAGPTDAAARAPDAVAAEFYRWYLDTLSADQDPLSDRYERFSAYVAKPLTDRLAAHLRSGPALAAAPPAGDYFLKADRYRPAWLRARVRALTLHAGGRQADVLVTLGEGSDAKEVLGLGMVLENGTWKIGQVVRAEPGSGEGSTDPPGI